MRRDAPVNFTMKQVVRLLLTGWSLVRIRPGEPNLTFGQIAPSTAGFLVRDGGDFRQEIKRLAQDRGQFSALP
jgi:hypothetical protein